MLKTLRYLVAASLALTISAPIAAAADPSAAPASVPAATVTNSAVVITLVTGDVVSLATRPDGHASVTVAPRLGEEAAPAFNKHEANGHVYVVPADVEGLVPSRLDWSLFDVTLMAQLGYDDATTDSLPLVVEAAPGSTTPVALPSAVVTGRSGSSTAMKLSKAGAAALGTALGKAVAAAPGSASVLAGIGQIRLDGLPAGSSGPTRTAASGSEVVTLTVNGIARDGRPAGGISSIDVINVDDQSRYQVIGAVFGAGGTATFSVPPGNYAVLGYLFTYDEPLVYAYEGMATFLPQVAVDSDTTVTLDAQDSVPIQIDAPDPTEATAITLCYYRTDALGASYSHSFTLSNPINTVFANPTDAVSIGDFEFYSQHSLIAPDITAHVVEPEERPIAADYVFNSAKLDGSFEDEMVYVGLGRVEDYEGLDVEGKVVLIQRGEITFLEKMQNAAAAGAMLAMIFNNVPGLLLISGDPTTIPTMSMRQAEGQALVDLIGAGTVIVGIDAVAVSSYLYDLVLPEPDQIPTTLDYTVDDTTTATEVIRYRSHVQDQPVGELRHKWRPWESTSFGFLRQMPAPLERVEHISSGDTRYEQFFWASSTLAAPFDLAMYAPIVMFEAGQQLMDAWTKQVVAPSPVLPDDVVEGGSAYRQGDNFVLNIPEFVDSRLHWGYVQSPYDTSEFRLYQDGELIGSGVRANGTFAVDPGPAEYRLEVDVDRDAPGWIYSAATSTVWTVQSDTTSGPEKLPLLTVDYRLHLDMLEELRPTNAVLVRWTVGHLAGSAASPISGSQLWVSYDEGATWDEVGGVQQSGAGRFRAQLPPPPDDATTVSLRVTAADEDGGAITQESVPAYALPRGR